MRVLVPDVNARHGDEEVVEHALEQAAKVAAMVAVVRLLLVPV